MAKSSESKTAAKSSKPTAKANGTAKTKAAPSKSKPKPEVSSSDDSSSDDEAPKAAGKFSSLESEQTRPIL